MTPLDDETILAEFIAEANEHLSDVEGLLLLMEAAGVQCDAEAINCVFRAIHSIKGAAGFLGLEKVGDLSHSMENVLNKMRNGELAPNSQIVDLLLRGTDVLSTLINAIGGVRCPDEEKFNIKPLVAALDYLHEHGELPATTAPAKGKPSATARTSPLASLPDGKEQPTAEAQIRIAIGTLDTLIELVGELGRTRGQLLEAVEDVGPSAIERAAARIDQLTNELERAITQMRRQPLLHVFGRFRRIVRDLSAKLDKRCELVIDVNGVEVDKAIVEAIRDPLVHLVRNALDHGIETPEERTRHGKRAMGTITLAATQQEDSVEILITDDGAGIDPLRLRELAVSRGILASLQAAVLSDEQAVQLIFHPGFTTASAVTNFSGRGVGMDVVKTNITKLGGSVSVRSELGSGTELRITIPVGRSASAQDLSSRMSSSESRNCSVS